jgi:plasmid maintenance system antidote protein VapI
MAGLESSPPTIGQYEDGTWYWLDETFNEGDQVRYPSKSEASRSQSRYCADVLNGDDFRPHWMMPPGQTIAKLMEERSMSIEDLAPLGLYCGTGVLNLLGGHVAIDEPLALRLEQLFSVHRSFWLAREALFRADLVRIQELEAQRGATSARTVKFLKITIEGKPNNGKSTVAAEVVRSLKALGFDVELKDFDAPMNDVEREKRLGYLTGSGMLPATKIVVQTVQTPRVAPGEKE